jgi:hypothetical protein
MAKATRFVLDNILLALIFAFKAIEKFLASYAELGDSAFRCVFRKDFIREREGDFSSGGLVITLINEGVKFLWRFTLAVILDALSILGLALAVALKAHWTIVTPFTLLVSMVTLFLLSLFLGPAAYWLTDYLETAARRIDIDSQTPD